MSTNLRSFEQVRKYISLITFIDMSMSYLRHVLYVAPLQYCIGLLHLALLRHTYCTLLHYSTALVFYIWPC